MNDGLLRDDRWLRAAATLAVGLVALVGCDRPAPPATYELRLPFSVPEGAQLVVGGKAVGTFTQQKVSFQLAKGKTLAETGALTVRLHTVCGQTDRPVALSDDRLEGRKGTDEENGRAQPVRVALEMKREHVPSLTTVWVDPEAKGDVKLGNQVLGKGPNRVLLVDCDEQGRRVTVGGTPRGSAPAYDPKSLDQLFIPASPTTCYALHTQVYAEGKLDPERRETKRLAGKVVYEVPLVSFFLREAPASIEVIPGSPTEKKTELARIECEP